MAPLNLGHSFESNQPKLPYQSDTGTESLIEPMNNDILDIETDERSLLFRSVVEDLELQDDMFTPEYFMMVE